MEINTAASEAVRHDSCAGLRLGCRGVFDQATLTEFAEVQKVQMRHFYLAGSETTERGLDTRLGKTASPSSFGGHARELLFDQVAPKIASMSTSVLSLSVSSRLL